MDLMGMLTASKYISPNNANKVIKDYLEDCLYYSTGAVFIQKDEDFGNPLTISGFLKREGAMIVSLQEATAAEKEKALASIFSIIDSKNFTTITNQGIETLTSEIVDVVQTMGEAQLEIINPVALDHMLEIAESVKEQVQFEFEMEATAISKIETDMVSALNSNNQMFSGKYLKDDLAERAAKIVADEVGEVGSFNPASVAEKLKEALGGVVDAPDSYWETYSTNALNNSRSYSTLFNFQGAGITRYEIVNPQDERTSSICWVMVGREWEVKRGLELFDQIAAAGSLEEVSQIAPFVASRETENGNTEFFVSQGEEEITFDSSVSDQTLQDLGVVFPPFHHRCRSNIIAVVL